MVRLIYVVCLAVVLFAGVFAQSPKLVVYRDDKFPFSITYDSAEWEVVPSSFADGRFRIGNKPLMGLVEFNILVRKPPKPITENELIELYTKAKADFLKGFTNANLPGTKILDSGTTYISSRKAVYIKNSYIMRNLDDEIDLTTYQTLFAYEGQLYIINFRAPASLFDAVFSDFKDLTSGFILIPVVKR